MKKCIGIACFYTIFVLALNFSPANSKMKYEEQVFDFGHVGIDFKINHRFHYINYTDKPVTVTEVDVTCDCSYLTKSDTVLQPGDTMFMDLWFETKNFYGATNKSFIIHTDDPKTPEFKYFYLSIIGQWFNGLKPTPLSLFFLPGRSNQKVTIPNRFFDEISFKNLMAADDYFEIKPVSEKAPKSGLLELEVTPRADLTPGTYHSCFTVTVVNDDEEETILTIPVKIVKY